MQAKNKNKNNNPTGKGGFAENPQNRNLTGQLNKGAVAFARSFRQYIVSEGETPLTYVDDKGETHKYTKIELVVRALYKEAMAGNMVAIGFIADRVEGKVKDQVEVSGSATNPMVIELRAVDYRNGVNALAPGETADNEH